MGGHRRTVNAQFAGNLALRPALSAQSVNGLNRVHRELIRHRLFSSEKTQRRTQSRIPFRSKWPVLNCPQVAGFHCPVTRLITQGTRSEKGQRYHERMWTAIATCAKQSRSVFHYLYESITAHLTTQPGPSLLAT